MAPQPDAALAQALRRITSLPREQIRRLEQTFRSSVDARPFPSAQRKIMRKFSPSAAQRFVRAGCSAADYVTEVRRAATSLALLNADEQMIAGTLAGFEEAVLPGAQDDALALGLFIRTLQLEVLGAFHAIGRAETRLINQTWRAAETSRTTDDFLRSLLDLVRAHFDAVGGSVHVPEITGSYRCVASTGDTDSRFHWAVELAHARVRLTFEQDRPLHPRDSRLLSILSGHTGLILQRLTALTTQVAETDRAQIARELHDGPAQALAMIQLQLEMNPSATLLPSSEGSEAATVSMRRITTAMHLPRLENGGLLTAIQKLITHLEREYGIRGRLFTGNLPVLDPTLQVTIYRIVQECFSNIAKHSSANRLKVSLDCSDSVLSVCVEDNGKGFDVLQAQGRRRCFGLAGIRARVDVLGGNFTVQSSQCRHDDPESGSSGTKIVVRLPLIRGFPGREIL